MKSPHVLNVLEQPKGNIRYEVMSYRKLSKRELLAAVGAYLQSNRKPKNNTTVRILTVIGASGR